MKSKASNVVKKWETFLSGYRQKFVRDQGWTDRQAKDLVRDAFATVEGGRVVHSASGASDSLPVFLFRSPLGWKIPVPLLIQIAEHFEQKRTSSLDRSSRKRVEEVLRPFLALDELETSRKQLTEAEFKMLMAAQAARNVDLSCDSEELWGVVEREEFWLVIEAAIRFGRRQLLAEIFADDETMSVNLHGQKMTRKGKPSKKRNRVEKPIDEFRDLVRKAVQEGLKLGRNAQNLWPFVVSEMKKNGVSRDPADAQRLLYGNEASAKENTVQKWVREFHRLE